MRPLKIPASDAVREEWLRRIEAEYRSAAITQHLGLWLLQIGASPDLVKPSLRIASDEIAHADLSHRTYVAAGGTETPRIVRETLGLRRHDGEPLEHDVIRTGVEVFCLGETIAVPLFKALREGCTVPVARRCLDRVLRDEVRHRDFGWTLLEWILATPWETAARALVDRELAGYFTKLRARYASPRSRHRTVVPAADRAWGVLPGARYAAVVERALERDYAPRFAKLGIDARGPWEIAVARAAALEANAATIDDLPERSL